MSEAPTILPISIMVNGIFGDQNGWQKRQAVRLTQSGLGQGMWYYYWAGLLQESQEQHAQQLATLLRTTVRTSPGAALNLIGHSNGVALILRALELAPDVHVNTFHAIAGATYDSCVGTSTDGQWHNGILTLLRAGQLGRCINYCSYNDGILGTALQNFPWWLGRCLGKDGFRDYDLPILKTNFANAGLFYPADYRLIEARDDTRTHCAWSQDDKVFDAIFALPAYVLPSSAGGDAPTVAPAPLGGA